MAGKPRSSKGSRRSAEWFNGDRTITLLLRLGLVLLLFFVSRILFFLFNYTYFSEAGWAALLRIFFVGLRFDLAAVLMINVPYIILMVMPLDLVYSKIARVAGNILFYMVNCIALMTNFIDTIYFRFTLKRLTADIFTYVGVGGDFDKLIPQFLKDFWFIALLWISFTIVLIWAGSKIRYSEAGKSSGGSGVSQFIFRLLIFIVITGLSIVGIRGGLQLRPIGLVSAGNYTTGKYIPLVLNTPFSVIKTIGGEKLKPILRFTDEKELARIYTPVHQGSAGGSHPLNVIILIMESFSREHIGSLNRYLENGRYQGFTPFLDSLMRHGYYVDAYANGKTSIQGIPAILSGIPSLMNESFIQSPYASGKYTGIAGLLKEKGYTTAFFHGGTNGTMGFDAYTKLVGFDHYYGRSEYNNEKDYDGKWGIRDEEFFQYMANTLNQTKEPFLAALFSLSSHHPYFVPARYSNIFRKGHLPIQQSVMYSDHALRMFFKTASGMKWYDNTLFVITADHTSEGYYPFYQSNVGQYAIPLLFFRPGNQLIGKSDMLAQQTDVMPTVLNYLGFDKGYLAFGNDLFDTTRNLHRFSIHYISGIYGMMKDGYYIEHDGQKTTSLFDLKNDVMQRNNLAGKLPDVQEPLEKFMIAYLQQYNNRLIENRLMIE
jgi:phosphoglycerol transferase MdoB-like AlkP superfamily enzyme